MAMKRIAAMLLTSVLLLSCVGCAQDGRKELGAEKADLGLTADVKPAQTLRQRQMPPSTMNLTSMIGRNMNSPPVD